VTAQDVAAAQPEPVLERRLHPLTPVRRAWLPFALLLAVTGRNLADWRDTFAQATAPEIVLVVVLLLCVGVSWGFLSWWFTWYAVTESELRVRTGLLMRRTTHVRLDRLQAVDITRPLLGRLVGVASLKLDVAGADRNDTLAYVSEADARSLRSELLARARGDAHAEVVTHPQAPADVLVSVTPQLLAMAILLRGGLWGSLLTLLAIPALLLGSTSAFTVIALAFPLVIAAFRNGIGRFITEYGWTVADGTDGLRIDHGLLDRLHETVPVGRLQTIRVIEPFLWRKLGWARVELHVASSANTVLVPVAERAVALAVVARVLPGAVLPDPSNFSSPPPRARWRVPLWWRGYGLAITEHLVAVRRGLVQTRTDLVPHAKAQSIRLLQGPWQRRLGLADVHVDVAAGQSVTARLRSAEEAEQLLEQQAVRSRTARRDSLTR
jgi:putative membrane protein